MSKIVALVPAHNEETSIAAAIRSLLTQTHVPDEIVVALDNCTDATAQVVATFYPAVLAFETSENQMKKAGALNQTIAQILDLMSDGDRLLVMDADSELDPGFVAHAEGAMSQPDVGAVGGVFHGKRGGGLLEGLQRAEYSRYSREIGRRKGRARVITGTAALFSVRALRDVIDARSDERLPGGSGQVYDTFALTEDNELTLALKHLGYRCLSPKRCRVYTDLMDTLPKLYHQRLRWQRGAVDNLRTYGVTKVTLPYIGRQMMMGIGIPVNLLFWFMVAYSILLLPRLEFQPLWLAVTAIFVMDKVWTVSRLGAKAMLTSMALIPELLYDLFQQAVYVVAAVKSIRRSQQEWVAT